MKHWDDFCELIFSFISNSTSEELQECQICHKEHDIQQIRITFDGKFLCDVCVSRSVSSTYAGAQGRSCKSLIIKHLGNLKKALDFF